MTTSAAVPMSGTKLLAHADDSRLRDVTPLIIRRWSNWRLPCIENVVICIDRVPPTSWTPLALIAPGTRTATWYPLREDGSWSITSAETTLVRRVVWTSTVGDSPVTVTDSSTAPTLRSPLTVAAKDPVSSMPSRLTVLNPGRVNVTAYVPGRRSTML